jgi:hypothetical protein
MNNKEECAMSGINPDELPQELSQAGEMVDRLIQHLLEKKLPPLAIASALLGGSMGLVTRTVGTAALLNVLDQARESVRSGDFEQVSQTPAHGRA